MSLSNDFTMQIVKNDTTCTIVASELVLTHQMIDPTKDYVVYADSIVLDEANGPFVFPGHHVSIVARSVQSKGNAALSTQPPPNPLPPLTAKPTGTPNGADGDAIDSRSPDFVGGKAGTITITAGTIVNNLLRLVSSGGKGRTGQNGGDGANGHNGAKGQDGYMPEIPDWVEGDQVNGRPGESGGNGGNSGSAGDGGDAGSITVATVTPFGPHNGLHADGGEPGDAGRAGKGGTAGSGGLGGDLRGMKDPRDGGWLEPTYLKVANYYPKGADGIHGKDGRVLSGSPGKAGTVQVDTIGDLGSKFVASDLLFSQLQLMLQVVKVNYLNRDYASAKERLTWIYGLSKAPSNIAVSQKWLGLHNQARALLTRVSRGLDYFGNAANFTPLASFALYSATVTPMLTLGSHIEDVFLTYTQWLSNQTKQYTDFEQVFANAQNAVDTYTQNVKDSGDQRNALWDECSRLSVQIDQARSEMLNAKQTFQDAVNRQAKCMSFSDIINLVITLVALPDNIASVFTAIDKLSDSELAQKVLAGIATLPNPEMPKDFLKLCNQINTIKSDFSDVGSQWNQIQSSITPDKPDGGKLAAAISDFDKQMQPYLDMSEAAEYKAAVHAFADLCNARNTKVMECSKLDELFLLMDGKILQTHAQMTELQSQEANNIDPSLGPYRNFLLGLYQDYRDTVLDYLFYQIMAFRYRTLQDLDKMLQSGNTLAALDSLQGEILQAVIDYENMPTSLEQPFHELQVNVFALLPMQVTSVSSFRKTGTLPDLRIPLASPSFAGWTHVRALTFRVALPGAKLKQPKVNSVVYAKLVCRGDAVILDADGRTVHRFTHNTVSCTYEYNLATGAYIAGGDLADGAREGGNAKTIALSPFSSWSLSFPKADSRGNPLNVGVDVSKVKDVVLYFSGKARGLAARVHAAVEALGQDECLP